MNPRKRHAFHTTCWVWLLLFVKWHSNSNALKTTIALHKSIPLGSHSCISSHIPSLWHSTFCVVIELLNVPVSLYPSSQKAVAVSPYSVPLVVTFKTYGIAWLSNSPQSVKLNDKHVILLIFYLKTVRSWISKYKLIIHTNWVVS